MKKSTGFFLGIGAGMAAGAVAGMMAPQSSRRFPRPVSGLEKFFEISRRLSREMRKIL